jgi:hypothetical protein
MESEDARARRQQARAAARVEALRQSDLQPSTTPTTNTATLT